MKIAPALTALAALTIHAGVLAQTPATPRVIPCDTTVAQQSPLIVRDEATHKGAVVENPILISLENGMKAVQFSVRHVRRSEYQPDILKVRYTVRWTDLCGRQIKVGSEIVNGFALDLQAEKFVQSTAPHHDAAHASLHVYLIN